MLQKQQFCNYRQIKIKCHNTTSIACINNMRVNISKKCNRLSKSGDFMLKNVWISDEHIPGCKDITVDLCQDILMTIKNDS